jgi:hypothetical protein
VTSIIIPSSVTEIPDYAFRSAWDLNSVTLPNGITKIGNYAFSYTKLTSITLPAGLLYIGTHAFNSTKLTSVTIPNSVHTIGDYAFWFADGLVTVNFGTGLKTIGSSAFEFTKITVVDVPDVAQIKSGAFPSTITKIIYCGPSAGLPTTPTCPPDRKAIVDKAAAEKAAAEKAAAEKAAAEKAAAEKAAAEKAAAEKAAAEQRAAAEKAAAEQRAAAELARVNALGYDAKCIKGTGKKQQVRLVRGDPPVCPKGFVDSMDKLSTYYAFKSCRLYKRDSKYLGSVVLSDGGRTLTFSTFGKYSGYGPSIPSWSDFSCATTAMAMPSFVLNQINTTRALDGRVSASWGNISATWTYHPDNGLNISFYNS